MRVQPKNPNKLYNNNDDVLEDSGDNPNVTGDTGIKKKKIGNDTPVDTTTKSNANDKRTESENADDEEINSSDDDTRTSMIKNQKQGTKLRLMRKLLISIIGKVTHGQTILESLYKNWRQILPHHLSQQFVVCVVRMTMIHWD